MDSLLPNALHTGSCITWTKSFRTFAEHTQMITDKSLLGLDLFYHQNDLQDFVSKYGRSERLPNA